jgi:hypothetical protein
MKNFAYVTTNFTGRKYMCVGLVEDSLTIEEWSSGFNIGSIYYECKLDSDGRNLSERVDNVLLLLDNNKNVIYADKAQFVQVEGMEKILTNMWIGLN